MTRPGRIVVYRDAANLWRWRKLASNGHITADSGQGYAERHDLITGIESTWPGCKVRPAMGEGLWLCRLDTQFWAAAWIPYVPISVPGDPSEWRSRR